MKNFFISFCATMMCASALANPHAITTIKKSERPLTAKPVGVVQIDIYDRVDNTWKISNTSQVLIGDCELCSRYFGFTMAMLNGIEDDLKPLGSAGVGFTFVGDSVDTLGVVPDTQGSLIRNDQSASVGLTLRRTPAIPLMNQGQPNEFEITVEGANPFGQESVGAGVDVGPFDFKIVLTAKQP